jgi:hypothetical protein
MAFGQGQGSVEGSVVKKYVGVASTFVLGVNPSKKTLEELYGRTIDAEPVYVGETEVNGKKVPQVKIDIILKVDSDKYLDSENKPLNLIQRMPLYITKAYKFNKDNTKVQVIDKYGRTAWATEEEVKNKTIPQYSSGPANIDKDYRPAYIGEEALINFLIAYVNIPSCQNYIDGKWVMKEANVLSDSEASLDHIEDYFKGDISELKTILGYQPNNKLKVAFGIRNSDDGKQYQTVYTRMFLKNGVNDYSKLDKDIKQTQNAGALSNCTFDCTEIHEYVVESTDFSNGPLPFPAEAPAETPWG